MSPGRSERGHSFSSRRWEKTSGGALTGWRCTAVVWRWQKWGARGEMLWEIKQLGQSARAGSQHHLDRVLHPQSPWNKICLWGWGGRESDRAHCELMSVLPPLNPLPSGLEHPHVWIYRGEAPALSIMIGELFGGPKSQLLYQTMATDTRSCRSEVTATIRQISAERAADAAGRGDRNVKYTYSLGGWGTGVQIVLIELEAGTEQRSEKGMLCLAQVGPNNVYVPTLKN